MSDGGVTSGGGVTSDGGTRPVDTRATVGAVVAAVATRPWLWPVAVVQVGRLARPGWWHRWPPLPLPDAALWRFRLETAYGDDAVGAPTAEDIRSFLHWSRDLRRWRGC